MERIILHIDFDSFFASVEQQCNPSLQGKPIGVTAQNGRTCIIASSKEAKVLGIKTGARSYEAKRICPSIILVPADFVKYFEVSKKFLNICKDYSPHVELFSIDEVFMDITSTQNLFGGIYGIVNKIKLRIKKEIGERITVSIGISHNKLLAKLASGLKKPNGIFEIKKEDVENIYKNAKLTDICGIGERIKARLNKIGIYTLLELKRASLEKLVLEFGKCEAYFLKNIGLAIDANPVISYYAPLGVKSISRNYCLPKNEYNKRIVLQNIYELCEEIGIKLRRLNKKARTVFLRLNGSLNYRGQKTKTVFFDTGREIFEVCEILMKQWQWSYIRMISIGVSNLEEEKNAPLSLFDSAKQNSSSNKNRRLVSVIDSINNRFGNHTIRNGFLLYADKLTTTPNGYLSDRYERQKLAKS